MPASTLFFPLLFRRFDTHPGKALVTWLEKNNYHLPEKAIGPINDYVDKGWTFVACRIDNGKTANAAGLKNGTLAPLKMTFRTPDPMYPMKLSVINPEPFDILVYLILPPPVSGSHEICPKQTPDRTYKPFHPSDYCYKGTYLHLLKRERKQFPTLAGLCRTGMDVFIAVDTASRGKMEPALCNRDLTWYVRTVKDTK